MIGTIFLLLGILAVNTIIIFLELRDEKTNV